VHLTRSYVLRNYVEVGVDELDVFKLSTVLTAKYGSIHATQQELGTVQEIQKIFIEFQQRLYKRAVAKGVSPRLKFRPQVHNISPERYVRPGATLALTTQ